MTNESRTIWFTRKGDSMQNGRFFPQILTASTVKISNQTHPSLHLHKSSTLQTCLYRYTVKVSACERVRMNLCYVTLSGFVFSATLTGGVIPAGVSWHTHAEEPGMRKLMPSLLLKDLNLWQVHEHILNQAGQMKLKRSSWKPCTGSCQFALMASNAITKAHVKQLLWISMICKGYK